jgi:hypothetical protein
MRPGHRHPLRVHLHALVGTGSIHRELEKVKFPEFFGAPDGCSHRGMVGEYGDVLFTS